MNHDEVLTELMYATAIGMTEMKWAPECIRWSAVLARRARRSTRSRKLYYCQQSNEINSLDQVMVTFSFSPEILYILANHYACLGGALDEPQRGFILML